MWRWAMVTATNRLRCRGGSRLDVALGDGDGDLANWDAEEIPEAEAAFDGEAYGAGVAYGDYPTQLATAFV